MMMMQVKIRPKKKKEENYRSSSTTSTTTSETTSHEPSASRQSYGAWQMWYASQGYPGFYDSFGNYHYYDPNVTDSATIQSLQAPTTTTTTQGTDTSGNDVYRHYANVQVGDFSQNTNTASYQQYDPNYQYYYQQQETEYGTQDDVQNQPLY